MMKSTSSLKVFSVLSPLTMIDAHDKQNAQ